LLGFLFTGEILGAVPYRAVRDAYAVQPWFQGGGFRVAMDEDGGFRSGYSYVQ
jgi:hypothetical protein